jgi:hypothetical protein
MDPGETILKIFAKARPMDWFDFLFAFLILSFPLVLWLVYARELNKRSGKMTEAYQSNNSKKTEDVKVWFRNFDLGKRKRKFIFNPFQTLYGYHKADLILDADYFVLIGKSRVLWKEVDLMPTVFRRKGAEMGKFREVMVLSVRDAGEDLEVTFQDEHYENPITVVLKDIDPAMKVQIKAE